MFMSSNPRLINKLSQTASAQLNLAFEQSMSPQKPHGQSQTLAKNVAPQSTKFSLVNRGAVSTNQLPNVIPVQP